MTTGLRANLRDVTELTGGGSATCWSNCFSGSPGLAA